MAPSWPMALASASCCTRKRKPSACWIEIVSSSEGGIEGGAAVGVAELGAPGDDDEIGGMEVATGLPPPAQPVSAMAVMATRTVLCDIGRTVSPIEDSGSIPRAAERFLRFDRTQELSSNLAHGETHVKCREGPGSCHAAKARQRRHAHASLVSHLRAAAEPSADSLSYVGSRWVVPPLVRLVSLPARDAHSPRIMA